MIVTGIPRVCQALPGPVPGKTRTPDLGYGFFRVGVAGFGGLLGFDQVSGFEHILLITTYVKTPNQDRSRVALIFI